MRASIIVRTYNEARHLPELLGMITRQTVSANAREVIIVDSGSSDGTPAIAERFGCRIVHIAPDEFSFGRSLNRGCAVASGHTLVFVSGHCVPTTVTWLESLIAPLDAPAVGVSYGRQDPGPSTKFSEAQHFRKCFPLTPEPPPTRFFCNNANAAVRADVWEAFRFDEELTGLEDLHFAKRVVTSGLGVSYVPDAAVYHHHYESWKQVVRRFERESLALQTIMPEVQVGAIDAIRYFTAGTVRDWSKAYSQREFAKNVWAVAAYRFCQYYGSWKGNHLHRRTSRELRDRYFYPA